MLQKPSDTLPAGLDNRGESQFPRTPRQPRLMRKPWQPVPVIYGPSGDMTWHEADPTYSVEAADRGAALA